MSIEATKKDMILELTSVRTQLQEARSDAIVATRRVEELERQERAFQAALDILEGKPSVNTIPYTKSSDKVLWRGELPMSVAPAPAPSEMVTLNGEPVVLEPGYKIGKNSFGEECIVPMDAADYPTMAEPTKPAPTASILPPLSANDGFDAPEDQL